MNIGMLQVGPEGSLEETSPSLFQVQDRLLWYVYTASF